MTTRGRDADDVFADPALTAAVRAAVAEADAAFDASRMSRQRAAIGRRIERRSAGARARVLSFPRAAAWTASYQPWRRWVAAAAVVGLVAGSLLGRAVVRDADAPVQVAADALRARAVSSHDEAFLAEFDAAVSHQTASPFRALDAITPEGR